MIVATAGHVDHGKTALVKALTSVDCDRLAEEKSRGITIRLGYAPWRLPDGSELSFVDVPGHEKLLKTMLSGIGCADGVLMVISAFEGIQPQTIEHMNACRVLGIERMVVAVTFADRVEDLRAAMSPISEWLAQTAYGTAPVVAVSSVTGLGLDKLSQLAQRIFRQDAESTHGLAVCLPIDRRFSMPGHGSVVTGSLLRGELRRGSSVMLLPNLKTATIRGIQTHGRKAETLARGHRVALNLNIERKQLDEATMVTECDALRVGRLFDAQIRWLAHNHRPVQRVRGLSLHLATERALADIRFADTVAPGGVQAARVRLDRDIPLPPGFRFVLRGQRHPVAGAIVGGGQILDTYPQQKPSMHWLKKLADASLNERRQILIEASGQGGITAAELAKRIPIAGLPDATYFSPSGLEQAAQNIKARMDTYLTNHPYKSAIPRIEAVLSPIDEVALKRLIDAEVVIVEHGQIMSRVGVQKIHPEVAKASKKLLRAVGRSGLTALSKDELFARFPMRQELMIEALAFLVSEERIVVSNGFCFPAREANHLRTQVAQACLRGEKLAVNWLKGQNKLTRKHSIPLWMWLDACGVTRRVGDYRIAGPKAEVYVHD